MFLESCSIVENQTQYRYRCPHCPLVYLIIHLQVTAYKLQVSPAFSFSISRFLFVSRENSKENETLANFWFGIRMQLHQILLLWFGYLQNFEKTHWTGLYKFDVMEDVRDQEQAEAEQQSQPLGNV